MPRPPHEHPTPGELDVLKVLWDHGPSTVREVMETLNRGRHQRAYTSVMSLLNVMTDKGLVLRRAKGRAFVYQARATQDKTLGQLVEDLWGRAFEGSAKSLVAHLLDRTNPTAEELDEIRLLIDRYREDQGETS